MALKVATCRLTAQYHLSAVRAQLQDQVPQKLLQKLHHFYMSLSCFRTRNLLTRSLTPVAAARFLMVVASAAGAGIAANSCSYYPHGLKTVGNGETSFPTPTQHLLRTMAPKSLLLLYECKPLHCYICGGGKWMAGVTIEEAERRLGTRFDEVPLEKSDFVKPKSVMYELDGTPHPCLRTTLGCMF